MPMLPGLFALALACVIAISILSLGAISLCNQLGMQLCNRGKELDGRGQPSYDYYTDAAEEARQALGVFSASVRRYATVLLGLTPPFVLFYASWANLNPTSNIYLLSTTIIYIAALWGGYVVDKSHRVSRLAMEAMEKKPFVHEHLG